LSPFPTGFYYNIIMSLRASIDVGSNTLRLLIAEVSGDRILDVYSDRKITRLGSGISRGGRLPEANIEGSLKALKEFSAVIAGYGVKDIKAVATSALREASNSDLFLTRALRDTGIKIEVITGEKEASLTLKGVLFAFGEKVETPLPQNPPVTGRASGG
jgi:exopolyphosphatase / guanosine-5'-triphosphate,3'-diphosphate pyrophosphatase